MKKHRLKLIVKNWGLRTTCFLIFIVLGNLAFLLRDFWAPIVILSFNLMMLTFFLLINFTDWIVMNIAQHKTNKFAKWLFSNKLLTWEKNTPNTITKKNKFIAQRSHWFSLPLWAPWVVFPNGIMIFYFPLLIFSIVTLIATSFNIIYALIIFAGATIFTMILINLWTKNVNDAFTIDNDVWNTINEEINKIKIQQHSSNINREIWTHWFFKTSISLLSMGFFTLSLLTIVVASKTLFISTNYKLNQLPYFENWTLMIFLIDSWKNGLFILFWGWLFWVWFINLWSFIYTPWYLLLVWRKSYLVLNILTLNFITISFWSVRFDDEEKITSLMQEIHSNYEEEQSQDFTIATTSSIIKKSKAKTTSKDQEQIITRVIPLDAHDENN